MNSDSESQPKPPSEPHGDPPPQDGRPQWVSVARVDEVQEGQARAFEIGQRVVAVFRWKDRFYAIDDFCPHMGASLATGHFDPDTMTVACPWHGWRFDVRDGAWCDNRRIQTDAFQVRVAGGEIQVGIRAEDLDQSTWSREE